MFCRAKIWDFPGDCDLGRGDLLYGGHSISEDMIFRGCGALVMVIDAQDEPYQEAVSRLVETVKRAQAINPNIFFEVFIHKVDGDLFLSDEHKIDCQRDIQRYMAVELSDAGLDEVNLSYYLTSIYDHSIFEAFSKVVQKLVPQLPTLENLLNCLIVNCNMEKSFLFDVVSRIYLATDSNPVDMQSYELCSDMIDVVIDVSCIYGVQRAGGAMLGNGQGQGGAGPGEEGGDALAYDSQSSSVVRLDNGMVLYLREVNSFLALVCMLRADNFSKKGLIDYNIDCFKSALVRIFEPEAATEDEADVGEQPA